ncbi:hypothetical protein pdam_00009688 [Pocillopora damicornis]|uniref:Uncharacterized protein n=1 Tax=Pocillopora damicornis TaxID=46731 RepID=A0A3M6UAX1_POCDA|nr:hypothetical protein pdam_00009688 [Pocillopora damicornis]
MFKGEKTVLLIANKDAASALRKGVVNAKYLPLKIKFNHKTRRLHPEPEKNAQWIEVCGAEDDKCQCRNEIIATRKLTSEKNQVYIGDLTHCKQTLQLIKFYLIKNMKGSRARQFKEEIKGMDICYIKRNPL